MFISPMLLEKRDHPFDDEQYVFEPMIDGHRLILSMENGVVRLFTRHNNEVTSRYPELYNVPIDDNSDVVLDGEVATINPETGTIDYELIKERFLMRKPLEIREAAVRQPVHFFVFDILRYKGKDCRGMTLIERKELLERVLTANHYISPLMRVEGDGVSLFEAIRAKNLEGIVAKRRDSRYVCRRDSNWLKIINYKYAHVEITGYRKNQFGWLIRYDDRSVGVLELAVPSAHKRAFYGVAKCIETGEDRDFVYVQPSLKAKVRFRNWTRAGMLRTPEFVDFVI